MRDSTFVLTLLALLFAGCGQRTLMRTPTVHVCAEECPDLPEVPVELRSPDIELLYVTDRRPEQSEDGGTVYGYGRSPSVAFGSATVTIGRGDDDDEGVTWEVVEESSRTDEREDELPLSMTAVVELDRLPETPLPVAWDGDRLVNEPAAVRAYRDANARLRAEVGRRLESAARKEVVIFVHGFNVDFETAGCILAETWHFLRRQYVPLVYTWPAGAPGLFAYMYDRESSEFTVFHLAELLRQLGQIPELEKVHIVAHSRGTDVVLNALRDLALQGRAAGDDLRARYRIGHLVIAAADIDVDVQRQRLAAVRLEEAVDDITVYTSQADQALWAAEAFFGSHRRLGKLRASEVPHGAAATLQHLGNIAFIENRGADSGRYEHEYFFRSPAVASDLILLLLRGDRPGRGTRVGLRPLEPGFWAIDEGYPWLEPESLSGD